MSENLENEVRLTEEDKQEVINEKSKETSVDADQF